MHEDIILIENHPHPRLPLGGVMILLDYAIANPSYNTLRDYVSNSGGS